MFTRRLREYTGASSKHNSFIGSGLFIFFLFCICCINKKEASLNYIALPKNIFIKYIFLPICIRKGAEKEGNRQDTGWKA